jgi:hypothetical protein
MATVQAVELPYRDGAARPAAANLDSRRRASAPQLTACVPDDAVLSAFRRVRSELAKIELDVSPETPPVGQAAAQLSGVPSEPALSHARASALACLRRRDPFFCDRRLVDEVLRRPVPGSTQPGPEPVGTTLEQSTG